MFISDFAIKRPVITVVSMVALVVFGIAALLKLQTDEFPDVAPPIVGVAILYPGASPETVERESSIRSRRRSPRSAGSREDQGERHDGFAQIIMMFQFEKALQEATQDIRDAISTHRADLPAEMEEPISTGSIRHRQPIVSLALVRRPLRRHAHPDGRPEDHARAPVDARRGGGERGGQTSSGS